MFDQVIPLGRTERQMIALQQHCFLRRLRVDGSQGNSSMSPAATYLKPGLSGSSLVLLLVILNIFHCLPPRLFLGIGDVFFGCLLNSGGVYPSSSELMFVPGGTSSSIASSVSSLRSMFEQSSNP